MVGQVTPVVLPVNAVNFGGGGNVLGALQAGQRNALNREQIDRQNKLQDDAIAQQQEMENTRWLAGATQVLMEIEDPNEFAAAADELGRVGMQRGVIDPGMWDISKVTPESVAGMNQRARVALGGLQPQSSVGKTWINPDTQTMWGMTRDGRAFDTGVSAQQYGLRPVDTAEGTVPFDPARGGTTGEVIRGTEPEAVREREAADTASQEESKRVAKLRSTAPSAYKSVNYALTSFDRFIAQARQLRNHAGLRSATGFGGEELSGIAGTPAADAAALANTLKSQSFITALGAMREASKTGGAVGNVSDAEGGRFENAYVSLEQAQSYGQYVSELDRLIAIAEESKTLLGEAYTNEYQGIDNAPALEIRSAQDEEAILQKARDAIAAGKSVIGVKQMLRDKYGIDPARL